MMVNMITRGVRGISPRAMTQLRTYATMEEQIGKGYTDTKGAMSGESSFHVSLQFSIDNKKPGSLFDALLPFKEAGINLSSLTTRKAPADAEAITVFADISGDIKDPKIEKAIDDLRKATIYCQLVSAAEIPWFPTKISDLDKLDHSTLAGGAELASDHPGFNDEEYKARRNKIAAITYKHGEKIPEVNYSKDEVKTWGAVWDKLMELYPTHACREYLYNFSLMVENCGYRPDSIPQLEQISQYLRYRTGFSIRPVTGLLSPRDFLNALAFRVFHSTQYIRHPSLPFYTPEPDVIHELMGHCVLFADKDFADFTQSIGLASLGASDETIEKLAACYWFSVEFGLCKQGGQIKAYGAGILGSFGELEYALKGPGDGTPEGGPKYLDWDPKVAGVTKYPITTFQPQYFVAEDFKDATTKVQQYAESFGRPFNIEYNPYTSSLKMLTKNSEEHLSGIA
eukprot:TRINITY_DN1288_c3_g1_i2.p1 TRINITY_DN1288_c3_g1~~TRINITY_DN1288_c3_g1_i2.p1  ORF type:complete len:455 (+),score=86.50 TRINITY_DN1288_c3_g1_i2:72-1436(+)